MIFAMVIKVEDKESWEIVSVFKKELLIIDFFQYIYFVCNGFRFPYYHHMQKHKKRKKTFTLIELLIVIVIIGILAAALIPRLRWADDRAKKTRAQADLKNIGTMIFSAQLNSSLLLKDITGTICSELKCRDLTVPLSSLDESHECKTTRPASLEKINQAAWGWNITAWLERDPWWAPYLLDENEWEFGPNDCRVDSIQSAWKDWLRFPNHNGSVEWLELALQKPENKDNIMWVLRPLRCAWSY